MHLKASEESIIGGQRNLLPDRTWSLL